MKRSLMNHCDVPSKHQKGVCYEDQTFEFCAAQGWEFAASPPATSTSLMPDGYIHLGDDMMLVVAEFLGYLKVHLRHYVVKNYQYIPTRTGIAISPYHWQVLSDSITLNVESPHACLMIERKLFLSVSDTNVVFQHVFNNNLKAGLQLSSTFLSVTHKQFRELCNVRESISQLIQKRLLCPLFLKAIREVLIVVNSDDIRLDGDEAHSSNFKEQSHQSVKETHSSQTRHLKNNV
ncbi:hypothetical protein AVEN_250213-1 [Araneus ventricosus]|uniref:Transcriptional coactivator p15 (PC4) C-terminal domain-containing protein n=1 Tax=Araneus ventricosus TaxID=182803 RepID=A0A4Y2FF98_ARAVE|nr:hypothetical protein AVEN_250213-1 [Araneus ventricosus]